MWRWELLPGWYRIPAAVSCGYIWRSRCHNALCLHMQRRVYLRCWLGIHGDRLRRLQRHVWVMRALRRRQGMRLWRGLAARSLSL